MFSALICATTLTTLAPKQAVGDIEKAAKINVMRIIDGKLYVGGRFERANRKLVNNVAVFDGTSWVGLGRGVDGEVFDIVKHNGNIFVCGEFSYAGKSSEQEGVPANRIARWDGTKWSGLHERPVDRQIYALASDGKYLYVGGNFTKINDETETRGVARYDGKKFEAIAGKFDRAIMTMAFHKGKLYVGGIFNEYGDDSVSRVAVYDGSSWSEVGNGGLNSRVAWLHSDGEHLYAAGQFSLQGSNGIAKWDGTKWDLAAKTDSETTFVFADKGTLTFGGDFNSVNGKPSHNVGLIENGKVTGIQELMYAHHRLVIPFGGAFILGGSYSEVQQQIGGVLKWSGSKDPGMLTPVVTN